jgi:chemotaxis protein MotB
MTPIRRRDRMSAEVGPNWLLTFADLIALLLAFFVLIYATQKIEQAPWQALVESLSRSLNPERPRIDPRPAADANIRLLARARAIDLGYLDALLKGVVAQEPSLAGVVVQQFDDRLVLSLPGELLFPPGEAEPVDGAERALAVLATELRNIGNRVDVFGHTDPEPVRNARFGSNWALSLARARAVARLLRQVGYSRRVAAYGVADSHYSELAAIQPAERRNQIARRVDIVVRAAQERY